MANSSKLKQTQAKSSKLKQTQANEAISIRERVIAGGDGATSQNACSPHGDGILPQGSSVTGSDSPCARERGPNKTEREFNDLFLKGHGIYEGISFHLPFGKYTPDWIAWDEKGVLHCFEVKGSYRFASESRAVFAFKATREMLPKDFVKFHWFVKMKHGWEERHK